jgi:hypothetical protein
MAMANETLGDCRFITDGRQRTMPADLSLLNTSPKSLKFQSLLFSILNYETGSKFPTKQRLTVNHATMQPKFIIRGMNFYRSARLLLRHCHNAGAACAYVFRESAFGQT